MKNVIIMMKETPQTPSLETTSSQEALQQAEKFRQRHLELTKKAIKTKFDANAQRIPMSELDKVRSEYKQHMSDAMDWHDSTDIQALKKLIADKKKNYDNPFNPELRSLSDLETFLADIDTWKYIDENLIKLEDSESNLNQDSRVTARTIADMAEQAIDQEPEAHNLKSVTQEGLKLALVAEMLPKVDDVVEIVSDIAKQAAIIEKINVEFGNAVAKNTTDEQDDKLNVFMNPDSETQRAALTLELNEAQTQLSQKSEELRKKTAEFGNEDKRKIEELKHSLNNIVGTLNLEMQRSGSKKHEAQVQALTIVINACKAIVGNE